MKTFLAIIGSLLIIAAVISLFAFILNVVASLFVAVASIVATCAVAYFGYKLIKRAVSRS